MPLRNSTVSIGAQIDADRPRARSMRPGVAVVARTTVRPRNAMRRWAAVRSAPAPADSRADDPRDRAADPRRRPAPSARPRSSRRPPRPGRRPPRMTAKPVSSWSSEVLATTRLERIASARKVKPSLTRSMNTVPEDGQPRRPERRRPPAPRARHHRAVPAARRWRQTPASGTRRPAGTADGPRHPPRCAAGRASAAREGQRSTRTMPARPRDPTGAACPIAPAASARSTCDRVRPRNTALIATPTSRRTMAERPPRITGLALRDVVADVQGEFDAGRRVYVSTRVYRPSIAGASSASWVTFDDDHRLLRLDDRTEEPGPRVVAEIPGQRPVVGRDEHDARSRARSRPGRRSPRSRSTSRQHVAGRVDEHVRVRLVVVAVVVQVDRQVRADQDRGTDRTTGATSSQLAGTARARPMASPARSASGRSMFRTIQGVLYGMIE